MLCAIAFVASSASAHVKMLAPTDWLVTNGYGDPQKSGQCGGTGSLSNVTTTVTAGSTLHVKWKETVLHPGHFRIAITDDRSKLVDPVVTANAGECISAAIQNPVVAPVLVDGLFVHTSAAPDSTYETDVTVPNLTCDHCTLQLIQFMSSHGTPCIYYHCADLKIVPAMSDAGVVQPDAGTPVVVDAGVPPTSDAGTVSPDGGTTSTNPPPMGCQSVGGLMLFGLALLLRRVSRA